MKRLILGALLLAMLGLSGCFYSTGAYYETGYQSHYHGHHHHHWHHDPCW